MAIGVWTRYEGSMATGHSSDLKSGFEIIVDSQSIANNTSSGRIRMYIQKGASYSPYDGDPATSYYEHDDGNHADVSTTYNSVGMATGEIAYIGSSRFTGAITERAFTTTHESNGTKTFHVKTFAALDNGGTCGDVTTDKYITLDTIPRGSVLGMISDFTYDSLVEVGVPFSVPCTKYVSSYYDVLTIKIGNDTIATRNNYVSGNVTLSAAEIATAYSKMTTSMYGTFTFELRTYTDDTKSTQIGTTNIKTGIKGSISETDASPVLPSNLFTYLDSNSVTKNITDNDTQIIQGKSNLAITMSDKGTVRKGATFPANCYNIAGQAANSTDTFPLTKTINAYSNGQFVITLTDSRGNVVSTTITISDFTEYFAPMISSILAQRVNFASTQAAIKFNGSYVNWGFAVPNDYTQYKYRIKESTASWPTPATYVQLPGSIEWSNGGFSYNIDPDFETNLNDTFALDKAYDIEIIISDKLSNTVQTFRLPSALPLVDLDVDNKRIGINKMASITKGLDVSGGVYTDTGFYDKNGGQLCPPGISFEWNAPNVPTGYLLEDGSAISRTTYADLFAVIGTTYGIGDGSTTFNVPDSRGRVAVCIKGSETEFNAMGKTGGHKLMQSHNHRFKAWSYATAVATGYFGANQDISTYDNYDSGTHITYTGGGDSQNLQPYIVKRKIIKY